MKRNKKFLRLGLVITGLVLFLLASTIIHPTFHKANAVGNLTNTPSSPILKNDSFDDGKVTVPPKRGNPLDWYVAEGVAVPGTGKIDEIMPDLVEVLCGSASPIKPLNGNCLLKIKTDYNIKAFATQTYNPIVIDSTLIQNVGLFIPDIDENSTYLQQIELREGPNPGATGQVLQVRFQSDKFTICPTSKSGTSKDTCKSYAPLVKNKWYKLRLTLTQIPELATPNLSPWNLKVEDIISNKVWWDSVNNPNDNPTYLKQIAREGVDSQIGSLFLGDECQTGPGSGSCDGKGIVYYDFVTATNPGGTGKTDYQIPGDANNDKLINDLDLQILNENFKARVNNPNLKPIDNEHGDFFMDGVLDGKDYAVWYARSGMQL